MLRAKPLAFAAAIAILTLYGFQVRDEVQSAAIRIGVVLDATDDGLKLLTVHPNQPADRAGLRAGDLVLSVDEQSTSSLLEYNRAIATTGNQPKRMSIRRDGQVFEVSVRPGATVDVFSLVENLILILSYLAVVILAILQRPDDLRARLLALLCSAIAAEFALPKWSLADPPTVLIGMIAFYILSGLQLSTELHLVSRLPDGRTLLVRKPWLGRMFTATGVFWAVGATLVYWADYRGIPNADVWVHRLDLTFESGVLPLWSVLLVSILLPAALRWPTARGRLQAALVLLGVLPWGVHLWGSMALELLHRHPPLWWGTAEKTALLCYPVALLVAIARSNLFDLELILRRSLVYTALTSALLLLSYGLVGIGGVVLSRLAGDAGSFWVVGGASLLVGLAWNPLRRFLQGVIDRRVFHERDTVRRRLLDLADDLPSRGNLSAMGHVFLRGLQDALELRSAALLLVQPDGGPLFTVAATDGIAGTPALDTATFYSQGDPAIVRLRRLGRAASLEQLRCDESPFVQLLESSRYALATPVSTRRHFVGVLLVSGKQGNEPLALDDIDLLDQTARHVATLFENARLFEAATYDSLTGLLRREVILERLDVELQRAQRHQRPLSIGMADLDHFKDVNDRRGHLAGDVLLKRVARELSVGLRSADSIGRYGGEEFLFVLPETDESGARSVAEKVRRRVETLHGEEGAVGATPVTVSIGLVSLWDLPEPLELTAESFLAAADDALYRAKRSGRNRIEGTSSVA